MIDTALLLELLEAGDDRTWTERLFRLARSQGFDQMLYGVGGRTAIGIRPAAPEHEGKRFDQGHPGLHHACFRMRDREAIEELHDWLRDQPVTIVHGPEEGPWAPGYYSILFEDPDGIRIEFNHVPGTGLLTEGAQIGGVGESGWQ